MWRALFLGIALSICLLGLECLVVDRVVLTPRASAAGPVSLDPNDPLALPAVTAPPKRAVDLAEWHPWSLLSVGAVLVLYSLTLRRSG